LDEHANVWNGGIVDGGEFVAESFEVGAVAEKVAEFDELVLTEFGYNLKKLVNESQTGQ
jgi:hypothetical protein